MWGTDAKPHPSPAAGRVLHGGTGWDLGCGAVTMGRLGRVVAERGWLPWETRLASARTGQRNQQVPARRLDSIQMAFFYWRNKCSIKKIK